MRDAENNLGRLRRAELYEVMPIRDTRQRAMRLGGKPRAEMALGVIWQVSGAKRGR